MGPAKISALTAISSLRRSAGMYDHIKSLAKMRAADVPTGTSIRRDEGGSSKRPGGGNRLGGGSGTSNRSESGPPKLDARNTAAVADVIRTTTTTVGRARISGFASLNPGMSAAAKVHLHEDSFQRRKGVVNTFGGAKDVNRQLNAEPAKLPPKGSGARVASFDTLETTNAQGQARIANRAKRDAANAAKGRFPQLTGSGVHAITGKIMK